jgi:hypothetical protein
MTQVEQIGFSCSACNKQYRWKPELAGKTVKCKCGQPLAVPRQPGGTPKAARPAPPPPPPPKPKSDGEVDFDGLYALAEGAESSSSQDTGYRCPSCQAELAPGSAVCMHCGIDLRTGRRATTIATGSAPGGGSAVAAAPAGGFSWGMKARAPSTSPRGFTSDNIIYEGSKFRSLYLPILLIVVGLIFYFGQLAMAEADEQLTRNMWVAFVAINFAADAVLIFIALIVAVKFLDMGFGALGPAVLKIFAIAIGPGAMGEIAYTALEKPMGELGAIITGGVIAIMLYYTLIKVLFQLDLAETIRLTGLIYFLRRWVKFFLLMGLFAAFMGGSLSMDEDGPILDDGGASEVSGTEDEDESEMDEDEDVEVDEEAETPAPAPAPSAQPAPTATDNSGL